jgi:hypothetical protein
MMRVTTKYISTLPGLISSKETCILPLKTYVKPRKKVKPKLTRSIFLEDALWLLRTIKMHSKTFNKLPIKILEKLYIGLPSPYFITTRAITQMPSKI